MYLDDSKKRTLVEKLGWMTSAYLDRLGIKPKLFIITHEDAKQINLEEIEEQIQVLVVGRPLRPHHFVLCQKSEDYLCKKESKNNVT
jgi:hypothetical protein